MVSADVKVVADPAPHETVVPAAAIVPVQTVVPFLETVKVLDADAA